MMNKLPRLSAITALPLLFFQVCLADDFKLVKNERSVALYERWVLHNGHKVRELKAEFRVNVTAAGKAALLLKNASKGLQWNSNASIYKVIGSSRPDSWRVYIQYDMPWPVSDLDCLLAYRYREAPGDSRSAEISFKSASSPHFPVPDKFSRMTGTEGKWILQMQEAGLKVTYLVKTDRSTQIPRWVSDPLVHENVINTMSRFKELLEDN